MDLQLLYGWGRGLCVFCLVKFRLTDISERREAAREPNICFAPKFHYSIIFTSPKHYRWRRWGWTLTLQLQQNARLLVVEWWLSMQCNDWSGFKLDAELPKGLHAESARAFTGRRNSHSGRGEDFLTGQPDFFTETAVTPERKVEKWFPRWEINRHAEG